MRKSRILTVILALAVILAMLSPVFLRAGSAATEPAPIRLKFATFTPALGERPALPPGLAIAEGAQNNRGYWHYLVQFAGPIQESWKAALEARGAVLLEYIPDYAFKVRMTPDEAARTARQGYVTFVDFFHPAYKLSTDLSRKADALYQVRLEGGADAVGVAKELETLGVTVISIEAAVVRVAAAPEQLNSIANLLDVAWVENFRLYEKHNEYGAGSVIGAAAANANGYDGSTQVVAVADTGLGGGTTTTAHPDIPASRVVAIYNWPGVSDSCWTIINDGSIDVDSGHGTHVATSVLGDGGAAGEGKGSAPAARLVFQSVENWADMIGICGILYADGYYLTGLPTDVGTLFQQAYDAGARIHSNSWGSAVNGDYTADSAYADNFIWTHRDMLVTFSAGNAGVDGNSDGAVDNDSIGSPATAKNVLTVGASENDRQGNWQCDSGLSYTTCAAQGGQNSIFTWGSAWPSDFPANPIRDDVAAGNAQQMAAFSSRGPTDDTRIKPDVVAPGSWILSGYSDLYQQGYDASTNPRNGAYQYDGWGFPLNSAYKYMGGTSMSNPITAGGAAVVRDFYNKAYAVSASAALVKASLINSASDMLDENNDGFNDNDFPIPNNHEGWGLVNLANATDGTAQFVDNTGGVTTGGSASYQYGISASGAPLKITVVWSDAPSTEAATINLVNDLDVTVTDPTGTVYRGNVFSGGWSTTGGTADRRNNVENVYIQSAVAGTWTVQVSGFNVPNGPQPFALVVDGSLGAPGPSPTPTNTPTVTPTPTAPPPPTNTGFLSPSANAPVTTSSGDNNGFQTTPANAYASDNLYAVDVDSGTGTSTSCNNVNKDRHVYYDFNVSLPGGAAVTGIEVRLEARADSTVRSPKMCVQLSWNGGASWTAAKSTATLTTSDALYTLGGAADTWGRAWTTGELANSAFRVRIIDVASSTARDFYLDWVAVNVTYQP